MLGFFFKGIETLVKTTIKLIGIAFDYEGNRLGHDRG